MNRCILTKNTVINNKYNIIEEIGKGTYSNIYKCFDNENKKIRSIKAMSSDENYKYTSINEFSLLKELNNTIKQKNLENFVPKIYDNFIYNTYYFIILEYFDLNLYEFYKNNRKYLSIDMILSISKDIITCLKFLKENNIIHRDVKPENFLIDEKNKIVICDFGLSIKSNIQYENYKYEIQTIWYKSPEVALKQKYNYKIDIWSIGCILYELLENKILFQVNSNDNLIIKINEIKFENDLEINYNMKKLEKKFIFINKINIIINCINGCIKWNEENRLEYNELLNFFNY